MVPTQDNLGGCRSGAKQRRGCISTTVSAGEATEARETFGEIQGFGIKPIRDVI